MWDPVGSGPPFKISPTTCKPKDPDPKIQTVTVNQKEVNVPVGLANPKPKTQVKTEVTHLGPMDLIAKSWLRMSSQDWDPECAGKSEGRLGLFVSTKVAARY